MLKIALDAGHGYNTPGKRTVDGSMREWEFNNAVLLLARRELAFYENTAVLVTSDISGKRDVPLTERTNKANDWNADIFVSIHANAFGSGGWNDAEGIETFVYNMQSKEALSLAQSVQTSMLRETKLPNRGVKVANFAVLRQTKMAAILVECGFMTNRIEAALLKTESYRLIAARAIVKGIADQYNLKRIQTAPSQPAGTGGDLIYKVQIGAFSDYDNAQKVANQAKKAGFPAFISKEKREKL